MANHGASTAVEPYAGWWFSYPGEFESVPSGAVCAPFYWGGPGMTCSLRGFADLEPGASATFIATVRLGSAGLPGILEATALGGSSTADFGYGNNVARVSSLADGDGTDGRVREQRISLCR